MIVSAINDAQFDVATSARLARALEWIGQTDMAGLENGRHEVEGDEIFANVMEVTTMRPQDKLFESHRRYLDVHYVIEGEELIGVAPVGECHVTQEYSEADDFAAHSDPANPARVTWALLRAGELCVTPPADVHKPACAAGEPAPLRKACVKVLVG